MEQHPAIWLPLSWLETQRSHVSDLGIGLMPTAGPQCFAVLTATCNLPVGYKQSHRIVSHKALHYCEQSLIILPKHRQQQSHCADNKMPALFPSCLLWVTATCVPYVSATALSSLKMPSDRIHSEFSLTCMPSNSFNEAPKSSNNSSKYLIIFLNKCQDIYSLKISYMAITHFDHAHSSIFPPPPRESPSYLPPNFTFFFYSF